MPKQPASKRLQPLYPKLPSGRSNLSAEQIAEDQLKRLQGAVVYAISSTGYADTTVADIIALAGVARRTFYEHFSNKEECFLAAYDTILARIMTRVGEAFSVPGSWEEKIHAAFLAFVKEVVDDPEAAKLVLIDAASTGNAGAKRRNQGTAAFEQLVRQSFDETRSYRQISDLTIKTIIGGVRQIIYSRLRQGRMIELPDLVPQLLGWAGSYRHPITIKTTSVNKKTTRTAATPASRTTQRLSKGRHNLPRSFVIHNQRERIIDAVATITAEKSYEELTVPDIASTAGLSHHTFYEHFTNKNHAFLAAFETSSQQALNLTAQAHAAKADWPDAVHAAIHTLIEYLVSEPAFARLGSVGILAAGPQALAQRDQNLQGFSLLLAPGNRYSPDSVDIPAITAEALTGGLLEVLYYYISNNRINDLPALVPELTYITLTPFLGTKQAAKASNKPLTI